MVSALFGGIYLKDLKLNSKNLMYTGIFLSLVIIIVIAVASFIMILTNISVRENNKINILAYGYFILGIITICNMYLYIIHTHERRLPIMYYRYNTLIQFLELILLYIDLYFVDEKRTTKWWMSMLGLFTLLSIGIVLKKNNTLEYMLIKHYRIMYSVLSAGFIIIGLSLKSYNVYVDELKYLRWSMIFKISYLLGNLNTRILYNGLWTVVFYTCNTVHCILIYEFIYRVIIKQVWHPADKKLNMTESELAQEELDKYNLVFASYALKNYMKSIDYSTQILKKKMRKGHDTRSLEHLEKIKNNSNRLMKLSNNILDLGQMDIGNVTPKYKLTHMNQLLTVLVESILPYIENRGLKIDVIQTETPVYCLVDSDEIERVLLNLISNAIKYNNTNGKICVYLNAKGGRAYICVEDTGVGIPKEKLKNIFERFERVDTGLSRMQEGSGLGLAIVKSIIEMHKGEIKIQSKEEQGTLVSFNLPLYNGQKNKQIETRIKDTLKRKIEVEFADLKR